LTAKTVGMHHKSTTGPTTWQQMCSKTGNC